jgi:glycosyltransferase involved in cell wall biosynthesis
VDGEEKLSLLRSATILVLPSHFENMPNIILEAMAAEMAVVATAVGAVPEMLGHGEGGILVRPGDREALKKGLDRLLDSPMTVRNQGRRNRETVAREFTMEVVQKKLGDLYLKTAGWMVPDRGKGVAEVLVQEPGARDASSFASRPAERP